jgi:hypothetical protein
MLHDEGEETPFDHSVGLEDRLAGGKEPLASSMGLVSFTTCTPTRGTLARYAYLSEIYACEVNLTRTA